MTEIPFVVEESPEGGFVARAVGADIFTEADDIEDLFTQARDAVRCHFDQGQGPGLVRLCFPARTYWSCEGNAWGRAVRSGRRVQMSSFSIDGSGYSLIRAPVDGIA